MPSPQHAHTLTHPASTPAHMQIPHDDNRLLGRNLLMLLFTTGFAMAFGYVALEAQKVL